MCDRCLSRRSFVRHGAGTFVALSAAPHLFRPDRGTWLEPDRPALDLALQAWRWIRASRIQTAHGITWPADPTDPSSTGSTLYTHGPGVLPFALELFHATQDEEILAEALLGADHLAATLGDVAGSGLYTGLAGVAFVLAEAHRAAPHGPYGDHAARATELLIERAAERGEGLAWPMPGQEVEVEVNDIVSGTAGAGLGLMYLARALDRPDALETATKAGHRLAELASPAPVGATWEMWPGYGREMPNFSHGTAGIAYFLATLAGETGEARFAEAAGQGATYLESISVPSGDGHVIRHHTPGGEALFYLSWCHGPVGTSRLFHRLSEVSGDARWGSWMEAGARGIVGQGVPETRTDGFWENVSQCCGTAGVGDFFLSLNRMTGRQEYRDFADRCTADLLGRSTAEGDGRKWTQAENRVQPDFLVAQTGHMQGAAGIGKYYLHVDAMDERSEGPRVLLPDAPF